MVPFAKTPDLEQIGNWAARIYMTTWPFLSRFSRFFERNILS